MKKYIVITGGAGFIGTNLIEFLNKKTQLNIISIDNYSSGLKKNHIFSKKIKYISGNTTDIKKLLLKYKGKIHSLFHFGEFSRIYQSYKKIDECFQSNSTGTEAVFKFCLNLKVYLNQV